MKYSAPEYVLFILEKLISHGYAAYIVGGCVRDILMGRRPHDWDLCTSAKPEEVIPLFKRCLPTGIEHGTVTVIYKKHAVEVTTFRRDGNYNDHRRPESVVFTDDLIEDLSRRDFTINAIAQDILGEIVDPFSGAKDIQNGIIRCVGDPINRFSEDALRMLRAYRFSAVLGFSIENNTLYAISSLSHTSAFLSIERVKQELLKIMLSNKPETLGEIIGSGLIANLIKYNGNSMDSLSSLKNLQALPKTEIFRLSGFCAILQKYGFISSASKLLSELKYGQSVISQIQRGLDAASVIVQITELGYKRLLADCGKSSSLCAASALEALGKKGSVKMLRKVINGDECYEISKLAVSGNDLKLLGYEGKQIGLLLDALLDHVLEYPQDNSKNVLIKLVNNTIIAQENS